MADADLKNYRVDFKTVQAFPMHSSTCGNGTVGEKTAQTEHGVQYFFGDLMLLREFFLIDVEMHINQLFPCNTHYTIPSIIA